VDEVLQRIDDVSREDAERTARAVFNRPMALAVIGPFEQDAFGRSAGVAAAAQVGPPAAAHDAGGKAER